MPELNVIDKPSLKSFLRKTAEWSFTSVIWGLWLYLLLPLVNIILWLLGIHYFFVEVIEKAGYLILLDLLKNTGLSILVVFGVIRIWGYYNYLRFRKKERRKNVSITPTQQISAFFQMPYDQVLNLQSGKEVICDLGDDGKTWTVALKSS